MLAPGCAEGQQSAQKQSSKRPPGEAGRGLPGASEGKLTVHVISDDETLLREESPAAAVEGAENPEPRDGRTDAGACDGLLQCLLLIGLKLQSAEAEHRNFLSRALYDLQAPITALNGYCGLLLDQRMGHLNPDQADAVRQMESSVRRLAMLGDAIFHLSLGELSERELEIQPEDIGAAVEEAAGLATPWMEAKRIDFRIDVADPPFALRYDAGQVVRVLSWLIRNACQFTPDAGMIGVRGYMVGWDELRGLAGPPQPVEGASAGFLSRAYRIDITDSGTPLHAESRDGLFRQSAPYRGSRDRGGPGLGLAACRMIVNAHRGAIFAESGDWGTTFSVVLPFLAADPDGRDPLDRTMARSAGGPGMGGGLQL